MNNSKKKNKKNTKEALVKLPKEMPFDEVMERLVKVKPPKDEKKKS